MPGTLKVRLESQREVAVRPPNLDLLKGPELLTAVQKEQLQKVVTQLQSEAAPAGVQARRAAGCGAGPEMNGATADRPRAG